MASSPEIRVLASPQEIFRAAAEGFAQAAAESVRSSGRFTVALSGGSTPKGLYSLLAEQFHASLPWQKIFFFWGDERHVPPDHPDSNFRMVNEAMLSKVPVSQENVFRVPAENPDANSVAAQYELAIKQFFRLNPGEFPRFDLVLLGLGPDGHCASLFPGTTALQEKTRIFVENWVEKFNTYRLTLTLPALNHAARTMFLVADADKVAALKEVLEGSAPGEQFPAKLVKPTQGTLTWLVDRQAAAGLSAGSEQRATGT